MEGDVMKIAIIGRGTVGGGLAELWQNAGHEVQTFGKDGGDVSDADILVLAVPGDAVADALRTVSGVDGKVLVDATNPLSGRSEGVESLAAQAKSITNGPVAKALNANFAALYDSLADAGPKPSCFFCADDDARDVTEELIEAAGYEPVYAGGLENAAALEDFLCKVMLPALMSGRGPFFYRVTGAGGR
jgi:8-hydroxy-5-deazaflavin:NADPH oxidoreductase